MKPYLTHPTLGNLALRTPTIQVWQEMNPLEATANHAQVLDGYVDDPEDHGNISHLSTYRDRKPRQRLGAKSLVVEEHRRPVTIFDNPANLSHQTTSITSVQGASHTSPLLGEQVSQVEGIITATTNTGFYMQQPYKDLSSNASHGIFVYMPEHSVSVGDSVFVDGEVVEYAPGYGGQSYKLTETQITNASVSVASENNKLPDPIILGAQLLMPPPDVVRNTSGDVKSPYHRFDPSMNAIDFYEHLSGMRVTIQNPVVVGPTQFGGVTVVPNGAHQSTVFTSAGGVRNTQYNSNPQRLIISASLLAGETPSAHVGDHLTPITGILHYTAFGAFELLATDEFEVTQSTITRPITNIVGTDERLAIASLNLNNLGYVDPSDDKYARFTEFAELIVNNMLSPDIITLEEVQDDSSSRDNGITDASKTVNLLIEAIVKAGGPRYAYTQISPVDGKDGGKPGSNIRNVFLYNPERVTLPTRGDPTPMGATHIEKKEDALELTLNPGRISPKHRAFGDSRKSLIAEFVFNGEKVFVIGNHFGSKRKDEPIFGRNQPPNERTLLKRVKQAQVIRGFVEEILKRDPDAKIVVLGDMNDFEYSLTLKKLGQGLHNLGDLADESDRYSYNHQGNSQALDHIVVSDALRENAQFEYLHVNADFADQITDHDVAIAGIVVKKAD